MKATARVNVLIALLLGTVQCKPEFKAIEFSKCLRNENDVHLHGMSWSGCLQSCRDRGQCQAVSYGRTFHHCILSYGGYQTHPEECRGFEYSEKTFWNDKGEECSCPDFKACDDTGAGHACANKECVKPADPQNGHIHGNMVSVGSRLKSSCKIGFGLVDDGERTCSEDGVWVNEAGLETNWPLCVSKTPSFISANQTSTHEEGVAELAIDGNKDNVYYKHGRNFCSHTLNGIDDMWTGNLRTVAFIRKVVIYNRGDCCLDRLNNFSVFVDSHLCIHYTSNSAPLVIDVNCESDNIFGQSVKIVQHLNFGLTLCEVEVY